MTMDRLLLHAVPAVFFLAGWHWAEVGTARHRVGNIGTSLATGTAVHAQQTD
jgi:hypothetical protein